ncbi:DUF2059 domain-containing protein [Sphingomonas mesophila]|uniref:DUF2059 domain-containing protein n=1 Tax=Sphingomonas mesophila TaxID=2303576 RepID=UPI0013C300AF|nr:DUF2059 domain-containing protein [Sphingomonas mesophila]
MLFLLAAMAMSLPQATPASRSPAAVSRPMMAREARLAQARWLIELFHPEAEMVASNMAMWTIRVRRSGHADPALAKIEREYPGAIDAYIAGARPVAIRNAASFVRTAKSRKAAVFADRLSATDLVKLIDFYRSPVGAKLLRIQQQPGEIARLLRQAHAGRLPPIDELIVARERREQKEKSVRGLDADELVEVLKFQGDPVALRYADAVAVADRELLELIRNPDAARIAQENEAGTRSLDAHIEKLRTAQR